MKPKKIKKQSLHDIARKKRHLALVEKMSSGQTLRPGELRELEIYEGEQSDPHIVGTMDAVGKAFNVRQRTVAQWKRDGMPVEPGRKYDLNKIRAWHAENINRRYIKTRAKTEDTYRSIKAEIEQLKLKKLKGDLIDLDEVQKGRVARITVVKRALLGLPKRMAPILSMKEPREVESILSETVEDIINQFAKD